MKDLDTKLLRSFVSVAKTGNMTVSAKDTRQTQGAISQQIKRLETLLGQPLFLRSGKGLALSANGLQFLPHAKNMIASCDSIFEHFQPSSASKRIRFGMPYDLVSAYLSLILGQFSASFPDIEVELHCDASSVLKDMIEAGELDLAMLEEPIRTAQGNILRIEPLVWIGKPGGKAHTKQPLPVSLVAESCAFRPSIHEALDEVGRSWRSVFENGDLSATMATVRSDMSVTAVLKSLVPSEMAILTVVDGLPELPSFAISLFPQDKNLRASMRELSIMTQKIFAPVKTI